MGPPTESDEVMRLLFPKWSVEFSAYSADERKKFWEAFDQCKDAVASILDEIGENPNSEQNPKIAAAIAVAEQYISEEAKHELSDSRRRVSEAKRQASEAKRRSTILSVVLACMAYADARSVRHDVIDRLSREVIKLRTKPARKKKELKSTLIDAIVRDYAHKAWMKNAKLRKTANGTASKILPEVNAQLKSRGMGGLGRDALRKRIEKYQSDLKQRPSN
jgi:hypothetical protein